VLPMANVLALEARRFATFSEGNEALVKLQPDITALRNQAGRMWKGLRDESEKDRLREPWLMFSLALAQAWGRAGNAEEMHRIVADLAGVGGFESRMEPFLLEAMVRTELATASDLNPGTQESLCVKAQQAYNELLQRLPADDANRERRVCAYNNLGWMLAFRGGYAGNEASYLQAVQKLNEGLRIAPDDYVLNRNLLVVLRRFRKPPFASAPFLEKCRAAVEKDKQWADDFEAVRKYMEAK